MANVFLMKQIKNKLQEEIDTIQGYVQREVETGAEDTLYRECKLFVFAKSVYNHIEDFISNKEEKDTQVIIDMFLKRNNIIEEIYSFLYEKNGTKYDLFMNKDEIIGGIDFFINHK
mgnify:CR=1 FL=1